MGYRGNGDRGRTQCGYPRHRGGTVEASLIRTPTHQNSSAGARRPVGAASFNTGFIAMRGSARHDRSDGSLPGHKRISAAEAPVAGVEASALGPSLGRQHSPLFTSFPQAASDLMHTVIHRQLKTEDSSSWALLGGVLAGQRSPGACRRLRMDAATRIGSDRRREPSSLGGKINPLRAFHD